jgi:5-methylcytosine-specific restriction endonuclease McrA
MTTDRGKTMTRKAMTRDQKRSKTGRHHNGRWISKKARLAIYLRDDLQCIYCLRKLNDAHPADITLDHVIPRSSFSGCVRDPKNLVTSCRSCNCKKGDLPVNRFAGPETRAHIKRNTSRSMAKYTRLAGAILDDTTGLDSD